MAHRNLFSIGGLLFCAQISTLWAEGPPVPVPYREIPDPPPSAERHLVITGEDRGPVWLLTGLLGAYTPEYSRKMVDRLKLHHWRHSLWPFWYPSTITATPRAKWGDIRDSPEVLGKYLELMLSLREQGMTWQLLLHHQGLFYNQYSHPKEQAAAYYDHIYTLVKYCSHMGLPVNYWEIDNEPAVGPFKGVQGNSFQGTWSEYLDYWDTVYSAIRAADPKAKIVGPSYGICNAQTMEPFLAHCRDKGQILDVLSWHEITQDYSGANMNLVEPDKAQKNIEEIRQLVQTKYPMLGIKEYHIDEWGFTIDHTGPGTQMAMFYYLDLAGVDQAAKATWTADDMDGILVNAHMPRTSYWAWVEYAAGQGVRLVTQTDDRHVIALASREDKTVRAIVARSKRSFSDKEVSQKLPPVKTVVDFEGLPFSGPAKVTILRLGPEDGPLREQDLPGLTATKVIPSVGGKLSVTLDSVAENQVYSMQITSSDAADKTQPVSPP